MAAYFVAFGRIHDQERFAKYVEDAVPTLEAHHGEVLAVEDPADVVEGDPLFPRVIILKFPSKEAARNWYDSVEYQAVVQHRHASSDTTAYLVDEFVTPEG